MACHEAFQEVIFMVLVIQCIVAVWVRVWGSLCQNLVTLNFN